MLKVQSLLRWSARATSIASVTLLLLFMSGEDLSKASTRELVGLSFFPLGVIIGLVVAWWREALGAAVATLSLLAFYLIYGVLLSERMPGGPWFVIFTSPAALFFASWMWGRGRHQNKMLAATRN
jgi:hypothetical protein